jgi:hypothetical protein
MRYSGAAVALVAAMMFSLTALGKTGTANTTFHVIKKPGRDNAPASPPLANTAPPCNATVCDQIKRYTDTAIIEATEYFYYPDGTCQFEDAGKWSSPNDIKPLDNGTPAGTVTFSVKQDTPPPNPYTGATCIGGGPYQYAQLHFTWNLRKNTTAIPRYGPTATFSSEWTGDLGSFIDETFEISVPVVHPIGESSNWLGSVAATGITTWQQTLVAASGDQPFDFDADCVKEYVWTVINQCNFGAAGGFSNFIIHAGSHYTDYVGLNGNMRARTCLVLRYHDMYFKSQAQMDYDPQPYTASFNTHVISISPDAIFSGFNSVKVARTTAFSPNGPAPPLLVQITARPFGFPEGNGRCNQ